MNDIATRKTDEDAAKDINWDWEEDWVSINNNGQKKEELL